MNCEIQEKDKLIESLKNEISEMKYEKKLDDLEALIKEEINEIIMRMHKHSIEDYINEIKYFVEQKPNMDENKFESLIQKKLGSMFKSISSDFKNRIIHFKNECKRLKFNKYGTPYIES